MSSEAATYVYCLVRAPGPPSLEDAPAGLAETGPPRVLAVGDDRWLVVADAPLTRYSAQAIEEGMRDIDWVGKRALEHEALVEHLLGTGTVVPMKLFTLFLGDGRALADVRARDAEIGGMLDGLEGRHEWGLRVLVDPAVAAGAVREEAEEESTEASAGKAFLLRKRRVLDAGRSLRAELRSRTEELYEELARLAADARSRPPLRGEGRLLLDASFLVPEEAVATFKAVVEERAEALGPAGLELQLSGPWPAYNFLEPAP